MLNPDFLVSYTNSSSWVCTYTSVLAVDSLQNTFFNAHSIVTDIVQDQSNGRGAWVKKAGLGLAPLPSVHPRLSASQPGSYPQLSVQEWS